jgi:hypothetical protein
LGGGSRLSHLLRASLVSEGNVLALAAAAICDPRTARKWLQGQAVSRLMAERLARAAKGLGIEPTSIPFARRAIVR